MRATPVTQPTGPSPEPILMSERVARSGSHTLRLDTLTAGRALLVAPTLRQDGYPAGKLRGRFIDPFGMAPGSDLRHWLRVDEDGTLRETICYIPWLVPSGTLPASGRATTSIPAVRALRPWLAGGQFTTMGYRDARNHAHYNRVRIV